MLDVLAMTPGPLPLLPTSGGHSLLTGAHWLEDCLTHLVLGARLCQEAGKLGPVTRS